MKNNNIVPYLLIIIFLLASCQPNSPVPGLTQESVPAAPKDPVTPQPVDTAIAEKDIVQLAWFYKPPEDGTPLSVLRDYYDVFILTHYDEDERDELRSLGVDAPFLEYLLFVQIQDPGSCDKEPFGNQVAYKTGDFCILEAEHPDWFLRDKTGEMIRNKSNVFMDPGNEGYRNFWLERVRELQEDYGWDGVFIDNVEASMNKFRRLGRLPAKYTDDASYLVEVENFLAYAHNEYFEPNQKPMYANIIEYNNSTPWLSYIRYLDGVMLEDFAVDYNGRYYSPDEWENQLEMAIKAQKMNISLIMVSQGSMEDTDRERFAFASYLLINNGMSSFRYTDSDHYNEIWLYENYLIQLGSPTSAMYNFNDEWTRDFTNGYVIVNPATGESEITAIK